MPHFQLNLRSIHSRTFYLLRVLSHSRRPLLLYVSQLTLDRKFRFNFTAYKQELGKSSLDSLRLVTQPPPPSSLLTKSIGWSVRDGQNILYWIKSVASVFYIKSRGLCVSYQRMAMLPMSEVVIISRNVKQS